MLAIIGGTGSSGIEAYTSDHDLTQNLDIQTPYGSAFLQSGMLSGKRFLFLPRHGIPPRYPPHKINYRANIWALSEQGVEGILAVNSVGSVNPELKLADLVFIDQVIDYTWGREHSFHDQEIQHIDFTFPFDSGLRQRLIAAAQKAGIPIKDQGVYGCTQGPRLETAAEIQRMAQDGCDVVGMTVMPEAALAREKKLPYAAISVVINKGAGLDGKTIDLGTVEVVMREGMGLATNLIKELLGQGSSPSPSSSDSGS